VLNGTIIPFLCAKAGLPRRDCRGMITGHRHYIRIRPTKLAASFAQADHMAHMVSVLIDHDMADTQSTEPHAFYYLGNSYCTNPFWSTCPRRMACAAGTSTFRKRAHEAGRWKARRRSYGPLRRYLLAQMSEASSKATWSRSMG
jgi:hypothetical protein